jgi:hypothetical protein
MIARGPMIVRDVGVLTDPARRAELLTRPASGSADSLAAAAGTAAHPRFAAARSEAGGRRNRT